MGSAAVAAWSLYRFTSVDRQVVRRRGRAARLRRPLLALSAALALFASLVACLMVAAAAVWGLLADPRPAQLYTAACAMLMLLLGCVETLAWWQGLERAREMRRHPRPLSVRTVMRGPPSQVNM